MSRRSLSPTEILSKQKDSLVTAIHFAEKEERHRMSRLQQSTSKKIKDGLESRFESDRKTDQTKISNLILDFNLLKTKVENGSFLAEASIKKTSSHRAHPESNRFAGNMGEKDTEFLKTVYQRFNTLDVIFEKKSLPRYNESDEIKKLNLLGKRRDVLNQLVNVHTKEMRAKGLSLGSLTLTDKSRGRDDKSETSSKASRESWATFASRKSESAAPHVPRKRSNVPLLSL